MKNILRNNGVSWIEKCAKSCSALSHKKGQQSHAKELTVYNWSRYSSF